MKIRRLPHLHGPLSSERDEPMGWLHRSHEVLASPEGSYSYPARLSLWRQMDNMVGAVAPRTFLAMGVDIAMLMRQGVGELLMHLHEECEL